MRIVILLFLFLPLFTSAQSTIVVRKADTVQDKPYMAVDEMPEFPGKGWDDPMPGWIISHTNYPAACRDSGITGTVIVQFVIDTNGRVTHATVISSVYPSLDAEALRVINSMPTWTPGRQNGKKVRVYYGAAVPFRKD